MEKIKIVMNEFDIKELCLATTGNYSKDKITINMLDNNITVTIDYGEFTDKIYGRKIDGKFYFARLQHINHIPDIDYYQEFFNCGVEMSFNRSVAM